jgi:hypothetical protein
MGYNTKAEVVKKFTTELIKRINNPDYIYEYNELSQQFVVKDPVESNIILSISYDGMYRLRNSLYEVAIEQLIKAGYIKE